MPHFTRMFRYLSPYVAGVLLLTAALHAEPQVERLATGFRFTEGPALSPLDGAVYFTDIPQNRILCWSEEDGVTVFREDSGGANGLMFDDAGNLYICEGKRRQFVKLSPEGKVAILADEYNGAPLNSPNDLWIAPDGGIYFTDPRYGKRDNLEQDGEHVYYLSPDRETLTRVTEDLVRPNGIVGAPDGESLIIADHGGQKTWRYAIQPDGTLEDKTLFADQGSDGMAMDAAGRVYLTADAIDVYSANGEHLETITLPERPANVTVIDEQPITLFATAQKSVYRITLEH